MVRVFLDMWPLRRRLAVLGLLPVLATWLVLVGRSADPAPPGAVWYVALVPASVLGAAVLASYLPVEGRGLDLGCTPCAMFSGLTVLGATSALHAYGSSIAGPLVAGAVLLFGLTQRMGRPGACEVPPVRGLAERVGREDPDSLGAARARTEGKRQT